MPSIPQSLLWISLVVLWLFVLVPMLTSKRDAVRRTSDVALATRVLTSGASARLLKRSGPATGHLSDPHWQSQADEAEDSDDDIEADESEAEQAVAVAAAHVDAAVEPDYLDVDVVDEASGALPAAEISQAEDTAQNDDLEEDVEEGLEEASEPAADEYEYVDDTSGLEAEAEPAMSMAAAASASAERRRSREERTTAAVSARKYEFRKRTLLTMAVILVLSALLAFTVAPTAWWICGVTAGVTVLYLAYLRRQTRIEQQVRARRARRMARSRVEADGVAERGVEVSPARMRRPGAAVLEIDDEDPAFEDLEYAASAYGYDWRGDLPRAAGQ